MNKIILIGRLTKTPELRRTPTGLAVVANSIAVTRQFKNKETGEYETDFFNFVSYGATAELIAKYFIKGDRIGLEGRLQTRNYQNQNGNTVYVTEVIVENIEFLQDRKQEPVQNQNLYNQPNQNQQYNDPFKQTAVNKQVEDPFMNLYSVSDDDLPF